MDFYIMHKQMLLYMCSHKGLDVDLNLTGEFDSLPMSTQEAQIWDSLCTKDYLLDSQICL